MRRRIVSYSGTHPLHHLLKSHTGRVALRSNQLKAPAMSEIPERSLRHDWKSNILLQAVRGLGSIYKWVYRKADYVRPFPAGFQEWEKRRIPCLGLPYGRSTECPRGCSSPPRCPSRESPNAAIYTRKQGA